MSRTHKIESRVETPPPQCGPLSPHFPERITSHLQSLIASDPDGRAGPVARQFSASDLESIVNTNELADPLGEDTHTPVSRLVRKYDTRAVLLVTDTCAAHCRYCFRKTYTGGARGSVTNDELYAVCEYLADHAEISELLLSGGDPLSLSTLRLEEVLAAIRNCRADLVFRVCTRIPVVSPSMIGKPTIHVLRRYAPVWIVVQVNHPSELVAPAAECVARFTESGIPVVSQTVLLRGVNDETEILAELFETLIARGVKPYQLFQADLVPGTSHFRVPLERGVSIYESLKRTISTLALPLYSVDAPGGGGKIPLGLTSLDRTDDGYYLLDGLDGEVYSYPIER